MAHDSMNSVAWSFERKCIAVSTALLIPLKTLRGMIKKSKKYEQIVASIRSVGIIEPPAVFPDLAHPGTYFILDGHLRIEAAKDLKISVVECMIATDDDTYSYNKRINRISAIQDHKMIVRAIKRGVPEERIAEALGISVSTIQRRFRMLDGICKEAAERLSTKPCPMKVFGIMKSMKPLRQIEAAELMIGSNNYSSIFANALLASTPPGQRCDQHKQVNSGSATQIASIERELAVLQTQIKSAEETFGPDVLHLTVIKNYLSVLLNNVRVVRWLAKNFPAYLSEFQKIAEVARLPN